jgi:superkiller protein 3
LALLEADLAGEAIEELGGVLALDSTNVAAVIGFARAQLRRDDTVSAGRALERAVAQGVDDARVYATLADVYERVGRPENAIPAMRLALARDPKQEAYHFRYGMLLTDTKAPAAAIIRLQESLTAFPQSPRLWLALGVAQQAAGKNDEATKSFARAAEIDAKFAPAYAYLGATYDERGQYAEAVNFYLKTIEVDPDAAIAYYLVAEALLKSNTNDSKQIERHLRRAVALDSRFAQASASLGKLLLRTDRAEEAVIHLRRAVEIEPEFAQAHYQLGRALQRLKRADEAQLALNTFKQLNDTQKKESEDKRRELVRRLADVRF